MKQEPGCVLGILAVHGGEDVKRSCRFEELSFRTMAQQLRLSEATVRRTVHAAEDRLRMLMRGDEVG